MIPYQVCGLLSDAIIYKDAHGSSWGINSVTFILQMQKIEIDWILELAIINLYLPIFIKKTEWSFFY